MLQHQFDAGAFCGVGMFRTTSLVRLIWGASDLWNHMFLMRLANSREIHFTLLVIKFGVKLGPKGYQTESLGQYVSITFA